MKNVEMFTGKQFKCGTISVKEEVKRVIIESSVGGLRITREEFEDLKDIFRVILKDEIKPEEQPISTIGDILHNLKKDFQAGLKSEPIEASSITAQIKKDAFKKPVEQPATIAEFLSKLKSEFQAGLKVENDDIIIKEFIEESFKNGFDIAKIGDKYYCQTKCQHCGKLFQREIKIEVISLVKDLHAIKCNLPMHCDECYTK